MAEVWRATDLTEGRTVALKRLLSPAIAEHRARLLREAGLLQQLSDPRIVRYLDVGFDEQDHPFLALEWLEGEDLARRQAREPLPLQTSLEIAHQALEGLAICHQRGVVHRDVKPSNLFLLPSAEAPRVKLIDFGLSHGDEMSRLTRSGEVLGTVQYLSPEQVRGAATVDHRCDLYALGVMLYELTTGRLPFQADRPAATMLRIISETPLWPSELCANIPRWLEAVIQRAMCRAPADRYASAAEMLEALERRERDAAASPALAAIDARATLEERLVCALCVGLDERHHQLARRLIEDHGGQARSRTQGEFVGIFGLEFTLGDEVRRALDVGLELSRAVAAEVQLLAAAVRLQVGDEPIQPDQLSELDRLFDALTRLPRGQLWIDTATRRLLGASVAIVETARDLHRVDVVGGGLLRAERAPERASRAVGREAELAALRVVYQRASEDREPECALVVGPRGCGKSQLLGTLLAELRRDAPLVLHARAADPTRARAPFGLLAEAVRSVLVDDDDDVRAASLRTLVEHAVDPKSGATVLAFVAEASGLSVDRGLPPAQRAALGAARDDPRLMSQQVAWAFRELFTALGARGPLALCLDDLDSADAFSLKLLEQLLEQLGQTPICVIAACSTKWLTERPTLFSAVEPLRVNLEPLGGRAMGRLVRAIVGETSRAVIDLVVARCAGNPHFAEALLQWLIADGHLAPDDDGVWCLTGDLSSTQLPVAIEGAIQGRLDRLPRAQKRLLKVAAVFGERFWRQGCEALGAPTDDRELSLLVREGLLVPARSPRLAGLSEWSFSHPVLRQVAYKLVPEQLRGALHLEAGRWLEGAGEHDPLFLAHHFERGGDQATAMAHHATAGAQALLKGDVEYAASCFHQALRHPDLIAARPLARRRLGLARCHYQLGRFAEASTALEQIGTDDPTLAAELRLLRGKILFGHGRFSAAEATLAGGSGREEDAAGERHFDGEQTLFWSIWAQGRHQDAGLVATRLMIRAQQSGRPEALCAAKLARAYCEGVGGDLSSRCSLVEQAVEHARDSGHVFREVDALLLLGSSCEIVGRYDAALESLETARARATRLESAYHLAAVDAWCGRVALFQRRSTAAVQAYRAAAEQARAIGDDRTRAIALAGQARALCQRAACDDFALADEAARRALALVVGENAPVEAEARLALACTRLATGDTERAVDEALKAVALHDQMGGQENSVEVLLAAHDALLAAGRSRAAREHLERAWDDLRARTERIADADTRASYSQRVPHNARVAALRLQAGAGTAGAPRAE